MCNSDTTQNSITDAIAWNDQGLVPAIAQDSTSGRVLMMAWMNADAVLETQETGYATYWSRSRQKLWRKGESSGNRQKVQGIELDCDGDSILIQVEQIGGIACHTGRNSCFYRKLSTTESTESQAEWLDNEPVLKSPDEIYKK